MIAEVFKSQLDKKLTEAIHGMSGVCWLNDSCCENVFKDIHVTNFTNMYPNIILNIHNEIIKVDDPSITQFIDLMKQYEGHSIVENIDDRIFLNAFYGELANPYRPINTQKDNNGLKVANLCSIYGNLIADHLIGEVGEKDINPIYIDVDQVFHTKPFTDFDFGIPYETRKIPLSVFFKKKRYMYYDNGIKSKGLRLNPKSHIANKWKSLEEKYESEFKRIIRTGRLKEILT